MSGTKRSSGRLKLALWDIGTVFWVCIVGSTLHFAFEQRVLAADGPLWRGQ